jgi:hypothetical protein
MRPLIASIKANMPKTVYWLQWDRVMSLDYNLNVSEVLNDPWVVTRDEIVFPVPPGSVVVVPPSPPGGVDDQASPTSTDVVLRGGDFSRRLSRGNQPQP